MSGGEIYIFFFMQIAYFLTFFCVCIVYSYNFIQPTAFFWPMKCRRLQVHWSHFQTLSVCCWPNVVLLFREFSDGLHFTHTHSHCTQIHLHTITLAYTHSNPCHIHSYTPALTRIALTYCTSLTLTRTPLTYTHTDSHPLAYNPNSFVLTRTPLPYTHNTRTHSHFTHTHLHSLAVHSHSLTLTRIALTSCCLSR